MKFLRITDQYGEVHIVNPRYIVKVYVPKDDESTRIVLAGRRESLNASEPTLEEIEMRLTGTLSSEQESQVHE